MERNAIEDGFAIVAFREVFDGDEVFRVLNPQYLMSYLLGVPFDSDFLVSSVFFWISGGNLTGDCVEFPDPGSVALNSLSPWVIFCPPPQPPKTMASRQQIKPNLTLLIFILQRKTAT